MRPFTSVPCLVAVGVFKEHGYIPHGDPPGAEGTEGTKGTQKVVNNRPLNFKATSGKTGKVCQGSMASAGQAWRS